MGETLKDTSKEAHAKFKIGDVVEYINEYGVHIGRRKIAAIDDSKGWSDNEPRYFLTPTDTPWYSVRERYLRAAPSADHSRSASNLSSLPAQRSPSHVSHHDLSVWSSHPGI
jgi:hypothetical protein